MYGYHGQTRGVRTWVVGCAFENLLGVEYEQYSIQKCLDIMLKKNHPPLHLAQLKYPNIVLIYPSKNGVFEM